LTLSHSFGENFPFKKQVLKFWSGGRRGREKQTGLMFEQSYKNQHQLSKSAWECLPLLLHEKFGRKKKHCLITFTIFTRELISSMSLPPEKRRDLTPIP
jgi:hypothetical protein